jgi:hypothetical protein
LECPTWGEGSTAKKDIRDREVSLESKVSSFIGAMTFLWLPIEDDPGPDSKRGYVERNSIGLLSNYRKVAFDPPSPNWLGQYCDRPRVRESGLWNSNHVDEQYQPAFLDEFERLVVAVRITA